MFETLREDINTVFAKDPAARSTLEVVTCSPGLHAVWLYRLAHLLWTHRFQLLGQWVSHAARFLTGIEIHPGATIGRRFFIDHGMGVVIGETAEIGDDVMMYAGVVLGGTANAKTKRHPTVEDQAVIGTGAIVLGPIVIGRAARVGAGSVVVKSVAPGTTVVGVPARATTAAAPVSPSTLLDHGRLPDPFARTLSDLLEKQGMMERRIASLENALVQRQLSAIHSAETMLANSADYYVI
jgi:serine O-acetyltransferase